MFTQDLSIRFVKVAAAGVMLCSTVSEAAPQRGVGEALERGSKSGPIASGREIQEMCRSTIL